MPLGIVTAIVPGMAHGLRSEVHGVEAQREPSHNLCRVSHAKFVITSREVSSQVVYAIVRAGGRQEKVSVGDFVTLNRVAGGAGSTIELPALLLVDGEKVTSAAADLA